MQTELENLKLVLSSPRLRAPSTLTNYLSIAGQFLTWLGDRLPPGEMDLRRYFLHRRDEGISEGSLRTYYAVLEKLYRANHWDWPLEKGDRPESPSVATTPGFTREEVEQLIRNRELYSKGECFYLSIATILAPRRIELARIKKRDIKGNTLYIDTAKGGEKRTHLVPDAIMPYIEAYHPKEHNVRALTFMFDRICVKGLGEKKPSYGWHSFRRTLVNELPIALAKADKPLTYIGYFLRWSRKSTGATFMGTPMGGIYGRPEILNSDPFFTDRVGSDPFFVDREVFAVHPFLPLWANTNK